MEFAKDEVFNVCYNKEKKESRILKFISNHKFIFSLSIMGLAVCIINSVLIYRFFNILINM